MTRALTILAATAALIASVVLLYEPSDALGLVSAVLVLVAFALFTQLRDKAN